MKSLSKKYILTLSTLVFPTVAISLSTACSCIDFNNDKIIDSYTSITPSVAAIKIAQKNINSVIDQEVTKAKTSVKTSKDWLLQESFEEANASFDYIKLKLRGITQELAEMLLILKVQPRAFWDHYIEKVITSMGIEYDFTRTYSNRMIAGANVITKIINKLIALGTDFKKKKMFDSADNVGTWYSEFFFNFKPGPGAPNTTLDSLLVKIGNVVLTSKVNRAYWKRIAHRISL